MASAGRMWRRRRAGCKDPDRHILAIGEPICSLYRAGDLNPTMMLDVVLVAPSPSDPR